MTTTTTTRPDLASEYPFLPATLADAQALRHAVALVIARGLVEGIASSHADAYADQVTGWLIGKTLGIDSRASHTRAKYRRILGVLEARWLPAIQRPRDRANVVPLEQLLAGPIASLELLGRLELEQQHQGEGQG